MSTKYTVYWLRNDEAEFKQTADLKYALEFAEYLRKQPDVSAVTFCGENTDQVGSAGVDSVKDGVLPDGTEYSWVKRRDGGQ